MTAKETEIRDKCAAMCTQVLSKIMPSLNQQFKSNETIDGIERRMDELLLKIIAGEEHLLIDYQAQVQKWGRAIMQICIAPAAEEIKPKIIEQKNLF